jgi:large subunit ribosomal protein L19
MNNKMLEFNKAQKKAAKSSFRSGDVVKVFRKIVEGGKERVQVFEGMIIAVKGGQSSSQMITVRKVSNGVGVEIMVPVESPNIEKIEMVKRAKIRQGKLYFIRERSAKSLKMKYKDLAAVAKVEEESVPEVKEDAVSEAKEEKVEAKTE